MENKKKGHQFNVRCDEDQYGRLVKVQEKIALSSRGQKPELAEIIRSLIGWGNPLLVSAEERAYIAGKSDHLSGSHKGNDVTAAGFMEYDAQPPASLVKKSKQGRGVK